MRSVWVLALAAALSSACAGQTVPSTATATAPATVSMPVSTPSATVASAPVKVYLRDEANVFNAAQQKRLDERARQLASKTGCEVHVFTQVVATFDGFETLCESLFRNVVKEAAHYKIVVIVLGYEGTGRPGSGRGKIYTALAAGLIHVLTKQKLEALLTRGGQKLTTDSVLTGIEDLAASLEGYFKRSASVVAEAPQTGVAQAASESKLRMDLLVGIAAVVLGVLAIRRMTRCPQCGARLRKQVKILPAGAEGGTHAVKRTAKCFTCGYVRKGNFLG